MLSIPTYKKLPPSGWMRRQEGLKKVACPLIIVRAISRRSPLASSQSCDLWVVLLYLPRARTSYLPTDVFLDRIYTLPGLPSGYVLWERPRPSGKHVGTLTTSSIELKNQNRSTVTFMAIPAAKASTLLSASTHIGSTYLTSVAVRFVNVACAPVNHLNHDTRLLRL